MQKIFDGHNDILLRLLLAGDMAGAGFLDGNSEHHLDAPRAGKGGFAGGFFAAFTPDTGPGTPPSQKEAEEAVHGMGDILTSMHESRPDIFRQCRNADEVKAAMDDNAIAAILHYEGAEAIAPDCANLEAHHKRGLRSLGPVWSRANVFGEGVPFDFPASPDSGGGLTDAGRDLVRACNALNIMLDVSHLNAAGFRDLAATTAKPIIATHCNAHALCESSRNLVDWQLAAIAESGGLVGVNFAVAFLREDGRRDADTPLETILRHMDLLLTRLGEDGVAIGSDFDGALIPAAMGDVAGLAALTEMMAAQYGAALTAKICRDNWLRQIAIQLG